MEGERKVFVRGRKFRRFLYIHSHVRPKKFRLAFVVDDIEKKMPKPQNGATLDVFAESEREFCCGLSR